MTIMNELTWVYGASCSGKTMIYKWQSLLKESRESLVDEPRLSSSFKVTMEEPFQRDEKNCAQRCSTKEEI